MAIGLQERTTALLEHDWHRLDLPDWFPTREAAEPVRWAVPGVWADDPEPVPVVPFVGELVAEVGRLLALISQVDPASLPPGQALGEAIALTELTHRLRHLGLARTQDVSTRSLYEHLGYRSMRAWQQHATPDAPSGDRTLARRLGSTPVLAAALAEQRVSFTAASRLAASLVKLRPHLDRPDGLIDGLPGEEVVTAVAWNVLDLVCQDRFGLEHDPASDPEQAAFLAALRRDVEQIAGSTGSQTSRVEQSLVLLARHLSPSSLKRAVEDVELQLLPSVLEDRDKDAQDKRALALHQDPDGSWRLEGTLTPEVGEQVFTALAAEARRDPANPLDTHARAEARAAAAEADGQDGWAATLDLPEWEARALRAGGDGFTPDPQLVPRSRSKRLHDALGRLLTRYLEAGLGGLNSKVPVQITATISARTIEGARGAPPARGASGQALARSLIRRWWCNAHVTALLMSQGWKPLGVVHRGRTITGTEMTAARVQHDNRCPGIGCCPGAPDPLTPLIPHHIDLFSETGETSLSTTLLPCPNLHDDIHVGKKTIRLRDGRFISEDGYLHPPS